MPVPNPTSGRAGVKNTPNFSWVFSYTYVRRSNASTLQLCCNLCFSLFAPLLLRYHCHKLLDTSSEVE
jgi:hypothetical protein